MRSNPVIVVPGITASELRDEYYLPPDIVWSAVLNKDFDRAKLHPDNLRYEALEPARVVADRVFKVAYAELIEELRFNLSEKVDQPVPVYPFAYDWRQPLWLIEEELKAFVDEVIERTKLLPHYHRTGYGDNPKVNLIGHSMGGLVVAGYLARFGQDKLVDKVATLASPFQGSYEAVIKIATGTANLGGSPPSSREREAARVTPALYHLLPSFEGAIELLSGGNGDIFNTEVWQPSIQKTLSEYVRLHALERANFADQARRLFEGLLHTASEHQELVDRLELSDAGLVSKDWLCVVGVNADTRIKMQVDDTKVTPAFQFSSSDRQDKWANKDPSLRHLTGDGTVPFMGAVPKFLPYDSLICVTPDDFGYWEIQDKALTKIAGFHGILPNMNMLHRLIVRHFTGRRGAHKNTWGRPAPGVEDWDPPLTLRQRQ